MRTRTSTARGGTAGRGTRRMCAPRLCAWGLCMLSVLLLAACGRGGGEPAESRDEAARPVVRVRIDSVRVGSIPELLRTTGATRALRQENVSSPVDGKVNALRVLEGDRVRVGDVIAVVETRSHWRR